MESVNLEALHEFVSAHGHDALGVDDYGNCAFVASINYTSTVARFSGQASVRIVRNGYAEGKISLGEKKGLNALKFHLDFIPRFGEFAFDPRNASLVITPKMGGSFRVEISEPIGEPAT